MSQPKIGDVAPIFSLPRDGGEDKVVNLSDFKNQYLVLYFYPKDDTPGCTTEATEFTTHKAKFEKLVASIVGVSKDTTQKHDKFIAKHGLDIILGADVEGQVTEDYGVWVEKKMYGKTYMGIQRATFLIGPNGMILHSWPKVRVKGHVEDVLNTLRQYVT